VNLPGESSDERRRLGHADQRLGDAAGVFCAEPVGVLRAAGFGSELAAEPQGRRVGGDAAGRLPAHLRRPLSVELVQFELILQLQFELLQLIIQFEQFQFELLQLRKLEQLFVVQQWLQFQQWLQWL
jgi:hypothetical protein